MLDVWVFYIYTFTIGIYSSHEALVDGNFLAMLEIYYRVERV